MPRLYYDPPAKETLDGKKKAPTINIKDYLEKVGRIIPAEILAGYLTLIGLVPLIKKPELHQLFYYIVFAAGAILTPIYINWQAEKGRPKIIHIVLSFLSFIVWAYDTTGEKIWPGSFDPAIAAIILVIFSLATGRIRLKA